ncbi:MAG: hypothetical protein ACPGWR_28585 [Ardenticatenaceae bacterium]
MGFSWSFHRLFVDGRGEREESWEASETYFPLAIAPTDQCKINAANRAI